MHYTGTYHQCFHNLLSTLLRVGLRTTVGKSMRTPNFQLTVTWYNSYTNYYTGYHKFPGFPSVFTTAFYNRHCPTYTFPDSSFKAKSALQSGKFFRMQFKSHISKCKGCTLLKSRRRLRLECYCGPHAFLSSRNRHSLRSWSSHTKK